MAMKHGGILILSPEKQRETLVFLVEFHTFVMDAWHCGEKFTNDEVANVCYLIGNVEGRTIGNRLNQDDMEMMDDWREDLEEWKADHPETDTPLDEDMFPDYYDE